MSGIETPKSTRRLRGFAFAVGLALCAVALHTHATEPRHRQCQLAFLDELGWQVAPAAIESMERNGGSPCERANLEDAHAAGDLRLRVPLDTDRWLAQSSSAAELDAAISDQASVCAFAMRIGDATRRAADKLIELRKDKWELASYPLEQHGFTRSDSWYDEYRRIYELFEKTLK